MISDHFDLTLIHSQYYENDSNWHYPVNLYPHNTLYFIEDGDGFVQTSQQRIRLLPGHAYLIPASTIFSCWCETAIRKFYVEFLLSAGQGLDVFFHQTSISELPIAMERIAALRTFKDSERFSDQLRLRAELMQAIAPFTDIVDPQPNIVRMRFAPILRDIEKHLAANLRLADLAAHHGFHPSTLSRTFRETFGITLKQYIDQLLVSAVKRELLLTGKKLTEIASEYHFCDAYYLSAFFKRHMGISPNAYRRAAKSQ